jgi:hypothetical protein
VQPRSGGTSISASGHASDQPPGLACPNNLSDRAITSARVGSNYAARRLPGLPAPPNRASQMAGDTESAASSNVSIVRPPANQASHPTVPTLSKLRCRRRHNCATADRRPGHRRHRDRRSPRRRGAGRGTRLRHPHGSGRRHLIAGRTARRRPLRWVVKELGLVSAESGRSEPGGGPAGGSAKRFPSLLGRTGSTGQERRFPDCTGTHDTRWRSHTSHD